MDESLQLILAKIDEQLKRKRLEKSQAGDRRKNQVPLPEGMENRRKLADRRRARLAPEDKEREE